MDAIDALLWGYQIKKLRHYRMHPEMIGNFSPVQSQLITSGVGGSIQLKVDSSGNLGLFNGGTEVMYWESLGGIVFPNSQGTPGGSPGIGRDTGGSLLLASPGGAVYDFGGVAYVLRTSGAFTRYGSVDTVGKGVPSIYGLDNRSGVTVVDGSPITLYSVPVGANQLFDAAIEIDATAFTSGTATYTMTYTENGVSQTIVVTATAINVVTGVRRLIQPDASTLITVQLTGAFVATVRLSAAVMQLA